MDNAFEIVDRFLAQWESDVAGRTTETVPPELQERLRAFARGGAKDRDRAELATLLKERPEWVSLLARQVKEQRVKPTDP